MKELVAAIKILMTVLVLVAAGLLILTTFQASPEYQLLAVKSGSMQPAIDEGSLVLVAAKDTYLIGDIIAYKMGEQVITHRVVAYHNTAVGERYITQGDANNITDQTPVSYGQILGKYVWQIPFLGYIVALTKAPLGFIFLIIIPATVIVYQELAGLKRHLFGKKIAHLVVACFISLVLGGKSTNSYFAEVADSSGNLITAASSFGSSVGSLTVTAYFCPMGTNIDVNQQPDVNGNATIPPTCSAAGSGIRFKATTDTDGGDAVPPVDASFTVFDQTTGSNSSLTVTNLAVSSYGVSEFSVTDSKLPDSLLLGFLCSNSAGGYDNNYELVAINSGLTAYCNVYNLSFGGGSPF